MTSDGVVSLYEASKRIGLRERAQINWTPMLLSLCQDGDIEVRRDPAGVPCCRVADLERLGRLVARHLERRRRWGKKIRAARPKTCREANQ